MIQEFDSYRGYLKSVLAERIARNPAYSLRSFAKQLDLSSSTLCEVLKGSKNLSEEMALHVANRLGLDESESDYLRLSVLLMRTKRAKIKKEVQERLEEFQLNRHVDPLSEDRFKAISDWYHFGILSATELDDFDSSVRFLSERLGIQLIEAEVAVERLVRLGMLARNADGKLKRTKAILRVAASGPSEALRSFHRQMLNKAIDSLESQGPSEKVIGTETLCLDPSRVEDYRKAAETFFEKIIQLGNRPGAQKKEVYHLGVHLFRLTRPRGKGTK